MKSRNAKLQLPLLGTLLFVISSLADANPMADWESWVLEDHPQHDCPWVMGETKNRACIWPGELALTVDESGASFTFSVDVYAKTAFVALPGSTARWPGEVRVNGEPAPVIERNRRPFIALPSGQHRVVGSFSWEKRPGQLAVPGTVAIVTLQIDGQERPVDRRKGQLIFAGRTDTSEKKANDSLKLEVFRLLEDGVPLTLTTEITLLVSGKAREVVFGSVMLAGTEVVAIHSALPARIEADGSMRAQVTAGEHRIRLISRFIGSPDAISTNKLTAEWPAFEYISFVSATDIRQAKLSGPVSVDTSQISIPDAWREYPTYRLGDGDTLMIETESRGDDSPGANELIVERDLWLDFDGRGITALDRISGEMKADWRLNAARGTRIGRATVDAEPVLITLDEGQEGIEVRSPAIDLQAVTRTESTSGFAASGWDARADKYRATLHLPPAWRVLHASGVDGVRGTWLSQWDLWDVFLVLIIIAATRKLISTPAAVLAGIAFLIALHEPGAPLLIIPLLLLVIALLPVVSGKLESLLRSAGILLGAALALSVISFAVSTFRLAIYPSLERAQIGTYNQVRYDASFSGPAAPPVIQAVEELDEAGVISRAGKKAMPAGEVLVTATRRTPKLYQLAENDRVQTGPGLPTWTWNSVGFRSSGPVPATQALSVYYSTPLVTSIWRVLSVFLVGLYASVVIIRLAGLSRLTGPASNGAAATASLAGIMLVLFGGTLGGPEAMAQDYPPKYLLDDLEKRLTRAPDCLPGCASLDVGRIVVSGSDISIRFNAYVDADVSLPLPISYGTWSVDFVGGPEQSLPMRSRQGQLFAYLPRGHHSVLIRGRILADQATIGFPLPLHNLQVSAPDWEVEGLVDGHVKTATLTLRSIDKNTAQEADTLKAAPAPAFASVRRQFMFGKKWTIETIVRRISPEQDAISVPVQLIPNENLLQDMGPVVNGEIVVQLGHGQRASSWKSSLEPTERLQLEASNGDMYVEEWLFTPSSLWRLEYDGIPPVKADANANAFEPVFRPWPGETLLVDVRRPAGVPGETHTVESALLQVDAGSALQRATLTLDIRASLGTSYPVTLPKNSEILRFSIDGRPMNTPVGNTVKIPLQPGMQSVVLEFQSLAKMGVLSRSPRVVLPESAANVRVQYTLPRDRWPLYLNGPLIGPAMLYWGVLCVILLGAVALPRLAIALGFQMPITISGWLLLGLGLSTVNGYGVLVIAVMFFMLAARKQLVNPDSMTRLRFNLMQCGIVAWVVIALLCMVSAIPMGLLANPEMQVVGNGSGSHFYNYYQDFARETDGFPTLTVVSVPIIAYRGVMLLWSLWLSTNLIRWAIWVWECFSENGSWMPKTVIVDAQE